MNTEPVPDPVPLAETPESLRALAEVIEGCKTVQPWGLLMNEALGDHAAELRARADELELLPQQPAHTHGPAQRCDTRCPAHTPAPSREQPITVGMSYEPAHTQPADGKPKVVCLCGSSKYPGLHMQMMMTETLAGNIVIPMGLYGHADFPVGARDATNDGDESTAVKQMLDRLHFAKIAMSDEVVIITVDGYLGSSTAREMAFAEQSGKTVRIVDHPAIDQQDGKPTAGSIRVDVPIGRGHPDYVPMTHQTCTICGTVGDRDSFHPNSGWDWYRGIRLCPDHAVPNAGIIVRAREAEAALAVNQRAATLARECPYCHAQAGLRCHGPKGAWQAAFHSAREKVK